MVAIDYIKTQTCIRFSKFEYERLRFKAAEAIVFDTDGERYADCALN